MVQSYTKKYSNASVKNIDDRFPPETLNVLDAFSIFNVENIPGVESYDFQMYCSREINVLADHYYVDDDVKKDALEKEFDSFKFELIELKKRWNSLKDIIESNQLKLKCTATEWGLRTIVRDFGETSEYPLIAEIARVALITPVSNAWLECGVSAVKRIKSRLRGTMGNDVLRSLLFITLNGPDLDTPDLAELIGKTVRRNESAKRRYKKPPKPSTKSRTIQTVLMSLQTEPISLETDEMITLETLTKLSKDDLVSNLDCDSLSSENSSDDEDE